MSGTKVVRPEAQVDKAPQLGSRQVHDFGIPPTAAHFAVSRKAAPESLDLLLDDQRYATRKRPSEIKTTSESHRVTSIRKCLSAR
jgi:hypothetical protein